VEPPVEGRFGCWQIGRFYRDAAEPGPVFMYVRREAVLSSQIEGTQASLIDVLEFEAQAAERLHVHLSAQSKVARVKPLTEQRKVES
jgi:hypothetical protein